MVLFSGEGEVLYVFPEDYRAKLAGKSFRMRVEPLVDKAKVFRRGNQLS